MRKKIVAGNWKMHKTYKEGMQLIESSIETAQNRHLKGVDLIFFTPFIHLRKAAKMVSDYKHFKAGAQNCHWKGEGAFTGEISCSMIESCGATHVIVGHSERRLYFNETNEQLAAKIDVALKHNLTPVFCCGESLQIREANTHREWVSRQIKESLFHLSSDALAKIIIAYEPVWAIGTGKNASAAQAQEMHSFIRNTLAHQYNLQLAESISILYGGSCKPSNASELFSQPDVDGGLIGGASLQASEFIDIAFSF